MAKKKTGKKSKSCYYFGKLKTDGNGSMKTLLGGKGANLAEMTSIGLPVPCGYTITTEICADYYKSGRKLPKSLLPELGGQLETIRGDLDFEASPEVATELIARLESNPAVESIRSVRISKSGPRKVRVRLVVDRFVDRAVRVDPPRRDVEHLDGELHLRLAAPDVRMGRVRPEEDLGPERLVALDVLLVLVDPDAPDDEAVGADHPAHLLRLPGVVEQVAVVLEGCDDAVVNRPFRYSMIPSKP